MSKLGQNAKGVIIDVGALDEELMQSVSSLSVNSERYRQLGVESDVPRHITHDLGLGRLLRLFVRDEFDQDILQIPQVVQMQLSPGRVGTQQEQQASHARQARQEVPVVVDVQLHDDGVVYSVARNALYVSYYGFDHQVQLFQLWHYQVHHHPPLLQPHLAHHARVHVLVGHLLTDFLRVTRLLPPDPHQTHPDSTHLLLTVLHMTPGDHQY